MGEQDERRPATQRQVDAALAELIENQEAPEDAPDV